MIDLTTVPYNTGTFPNVVANDSSTPSTTDGTPLLQTWVRDSFGWKQATLYHAGVSSPSGSNETYNTSTGTAEDSEILTSIQRVAGHPGEVVAWMGTGTIPTGIRIFELTGQVILNADYVDLVEAVYVGDALNPTAEAYYKTSDAGGTTRSTSGTYMVMPSLVGYFLRGLDTAAAVDPQGSGRTVGDRQVDSVKEHSHEIYAGLQHPVYSDVSISQYGSGTPGPHQLAFNAGTNEWSAEDVTSPGDHDETRPVNSATRWCIRY